MWVHFLLTIIPQFDSGATHNFISKTYVEKHSITSRKLSCPHIISTPGGKILSNEATTNTSLLLGSKTYPTSLVILKGQGLDAILGMKWMDFHKAVLDIAARAVYLDSLIHGRDSIRLTSPHTILPVVYKTTSKSLE